MMYVKVNSGGKSSKGNKWITINCYKTAHRPENQLVSTIVDIMINIIITLYMIRVIIIITILVIKGIIVVLKSMSHNNEVSFGIFCICFNVCMLNVKILSQY